VTYRERAAGVPGVELWESSVTPAARARILPDGCLDLIWDGRELLVAGPDSAARWHDSAAGSTYTGLRFHRGLGPALLRLPASDVLDLSPGLAEVAAVCGYADQAHLTRELAALGGAPPTSLLAS
jgi:hypothetical protein